MAAVHRGEAIRHRIAGLTGPPGGWRPPTGGPWLFFRTARPGKQVGILSPAQLRCRLGDMFCPTTCSQRRAPFVKSSRKQSILPASTRSWNWCGDQIAAENALFRRDLLAKSLFGPPSSWSRPVCSHTVLAWRHPQARLKLRRQPPALARSPGGFQPW
jgi:hypothetical protein